MDRRDFFAGMALANPRTHFKHECAETPMDVARQAWNIADSMLEVEYHSQPEHLPVMVVDVHGDTCSFKCPSCNETHTHGAPENEGVLEHRGSHCTGRYKKGYYILSMPDS